MTRRNGNERSRVHFEAQSRFERDEVASILNDYIQQYVGAAFPAYTSGSGVYQQQDRVLLFQTYLDLYGYDLYDEVERDPHVSAVMQTRKLTVAGLDWKIHPASDSPEDVRVAQFVDSVIREMEGITQDLIELLDAIGKGFSVSEVMWSVNEEGYIVPNKLKHRPQRRFQFDAATGNLKLRTKANPFYGEPVPDRKFIIHRNSQKYELPFGDALDQRLYWPWSFKRIVTKFWMQHAETTAAPIPIVTHPNDAKQSVKDEALEVAKKIRSGSYGRKPQNLTIEFAEAKNARATGSTYEELVRFFNDEMTKCVLGQVLTTEGSGAGGAGSKALGTVHNTVRRDILEYDARSLEETLNKTLIRWVVDYNFVVKRCPQFRFDLSEPVDVKSLAEAVSTLSNAGKSVDDEWVEKTLGVKLVKEGDEFNVE